MRKAKSNLRPKQLVSLEAGNVKTGRRELYGEMSEA